MEQIQAESCKAAAAARWDASVVGHEPGRFVPWLSCIRERNWIRQLSPPKKWPDLMSVHLTHTLAARRDQFTAPLRPSSPSTSPVSRRRLVCPCDRVLGEDPGGVSAIPYRGLLLLRVRIAFIICAKRGV